MIKMNELKLLLSFLIVLLSTFHIFGQTTQTLGDKVTLAIKKELPELTVVEPITLQPYFRSIDPLIKSKWKTKDGRTVSIEFLIVGDLDEKAKEEDFDGYMMRPLAPTSRRIDGISNKAILVSRLGLKESVVEIRFFKENLRIDIQLENPHKTQNSYNQPAPKAEEEKAYKIAQVVANAIDRETTYSPCFNDFQKPIVNIGSLPEEKLFAAIIRAEVTEVEKITKERINFDSVLVSNPYVKTADYHGNKPLHIAAIQGCPEIVKSLIEAKADINIKNRFGETPLMLAVSEGRVEVVRLLLESGADVNFKNSKGRNAAFYFYLFRPISRPSTPAQPRIEILKLLSQYGLNLKEKETLYGNNLLTEFPCSFKNWCPEITNFLLDEGLDINETNNDGVTVLLKVIIYAMGNNSWDYPEQALTTLKNLISRGANVNVRYKNKSILEYVMERKKETYSNKTDEIIQILKDAGAK